MREINSELLRGIVEVDETYVGGKFAGWDAATRETRLLLSEQFSAQGKIRLQVIPDATKATLHKFIHDNTAPDTEAIYTDEMPAYWGIDGADTQHQWVNHSQEEWIVGDVHTNSVESVWSLLKRSIIGSYHRVSIKHLDAYLDELEHRFNNRKNEYIF